MNAENFYIVATAPNDPSLQVRISGPYLTEQAAHADLEAAIVEAADIDGRSGLTDLLIMVASYSVCLYVGRKDVRCASAA